ncbi:hypothetical protein TH63_07845 [Rufibacter radiotolerans]|uniref:Lipoprotein n=1 Tax=Rufibacter radiotolerans TaxID=1379910 RepID=A0A0H4VIH8_9BACT|nr:hypothetical protein [Rufibacter radiotolerans]AKQ45580.1 hypothetical protein TH63_07845 [Rufibacter radiotolerans]
MKKLLLVVAILAGIFSSCGDEEVVLDPLKTGQAYYPMEVGTYRVYNVKETKYTNNVGTTTLLQTRELVKGVSKDQTGKEWYTVEVSQRANANQSWIVTGVKAISKSTRDLQLQTNNRIVVEMVYPVEEGKSWNPNAFNPNYFPKEEDRQLRDTFFYEQIGASFDVAGKTYPNTLKVNKAKSDPDDFINEVEVYEIYAADLGSIYRFSKVRYNCDASPGTNCQIGSGYIISGTDRIEELESSGKI